MGDKKTTTLSMTVLIDGSPCAVTLTKRANTSGVYRLVKVTVNTEVVWPTQDISRFWENKYYPWEVLIPVAQKLMETIGPVYTAREMGIHYNALHNALRRARQAGSRVPPKPKATLRLSICEKCIHGYADDCFAVPFEMRTWVKQYEEIPHSSARHYVVRMVTSCDMFEPGRKPLPLELPPPVKDAWCRASFALAKYKGKRGMDAKWG